VIEAADQHERFLSYFLAHQSEIEAVIGAWVRDWHARQDLLQEVALVLWQKFGEYDASRPFGAWARGITVKKVMQWFAKQHRAPLPLSPETIEAVIAAFDETAPDPDEARRIEAALAECLETLPEKSRRLVRMRYEERRTLGEIAQTIASTLDAVNKALSRIRRALRSCIEERLAEVEP